ncbi:MAG: bifunctional glutamate N-acetyltransferase/amino-acid acetyltransferase ArgJ, partial [Pseudomonadota bacterium]
MLLKPSPFAPNAFPSLPKVGGMTSATGSRGFYAASGLIRDDVFLVSFDPNTAAAGVFTRSSTRSADVDWCRHALKRSSGAARALIVNAGNSNAFTGRFGIQKNDATLDAIEASMGVHREQTYSAATGVIGEPLPDPNYVGAAVPGLTGRLGEPEWECLAKAFMTTDTFPKGSGAITEIDGRRTAISGIAKGSGMIAPNMATMLAFVFTDAAISPAVLQSLLSKHVDTTFNAITVDSDTSTSDTCMVFATGASGAPMIDNLNDPRLEEFERAFARVLKDLALWIVKDGEGISKLIEVNVGGARNNRDAKAVAVSIANSPLVKTALGAGDANWGRLVM